MCVAIYQPEGKAVPENILAASVKRNDDGYGIVYWDEFGNPHSVHGMDNSKFVDLAKEYAGREALIHCRIGTAGEKDIRNTHPFVLHPFGDPFKPAYYLMHNGILPIEVHATDPNSDTYYFARYLEKLGDFPALLDDPDWCRVTEDLIGGNKILIAGPERKLWFLNRYLGTWHEGIWYSNNLSLPSEKKSWGGYSSYGGTKDVHTVGHVTTYDTHGGVTDDYDSLSQWGATELWIDRVDPESGVKTQVFGGWKLEDGTVIPAGEQTCTPSAVSAATSSAATTKDEDKDEDFSSFSYGEHPLELLASWYGEVLEAGSDPKLLDEAESIIAFDVKTVGHEAIAHAILLLMKRNVETSRKEASAVATVTAIAKVSEAQEQPRKLTRAERRAQRREKRHMLQLT